MKRPKNALKKTAEDRVINAVILVVMVFVFVVTAYPFYYVLIMSLNNGTDALRAGIYFWPACSPLRITRSSFRTHQMAAGRARIRCAHGGGQRCWGCFSPAWSHTPCPSAIFACRFYYAVMIACMYFSGGLIPFYLTLRQIGLLNNFLVYVSPGC
jgi:putative aldouronate transport system permease protein